MRLDVQVNVKAIVVFKESKRNAGQVPLVVQVGLAGQLRLEGRVHLGGQVRMGGQVWKLNAAATATCHYQ